VQPVRQIKKTKIMRLSQSFDSIRLTKLMRGGKEKLASEGLMKMSNKNRGLLYFSLQTGFVITKGCAACHLNIMYYNASAIIGFLFNCLWFILR